MDSLSPMFLFFTHMGCYIIGVIIGVFLATKKKDTNDQ